MNKFVFSIFVFFVDISRSFILSFIFLIQPNVPRQTNVNWMWDWNLISFYNPSYWRPIEKNKMFWIFNMLPEPAIKKIGKIWLGSKLSLGLMYGLSFRIQTTLYFPQSWVQKTGLIFYLADFHGRNWLIPGFDENITQHWALFSTKTNQGRFYFQWA